MPWQLALGIFFIFAVAQALFQRSYSQQHKLPEVVPPALSYLIGVMPVGIVVGLLLDHSVDWSWWLALLLAGEGILIGLYNWLSFMAIRRLPLAKFQTIYQLYEIVVIILGWSLLHERLTIWQFLGGLFILCGVFLAIHAHSKEETPLPSGDRVSAVGLTVVAAIVMGCGLVIEKAALGHMDSGAYFIFGYGTQTLALLVLAVPSLRRVGIRAITRQDYKKSAIMGALSASVGFFYIFAIVNADNISLVTALAAFSLPLTVLAAYAFLRERDNIKLLLIGVALGLTGLVISAIH